MTREAFLSRVREATAAGRKYRVTSGPPGSQRVGYSGGGDDLVARLLDEVAIAGGVAHRVGPDRFVGAVLEELFREHRARTAFCWAHPLFDELRLGVTLGSCGVEALWPSDLAALPPHERTGRMLACDVGLTAVDLAIAETGTLAVYSSPRQPRLASLLPPVHIALVEKARIVPDMFDLFDAISVGSLPPNLTFITGPSKTGDIELKLTTGVHGPGVWHVVVLG